MKRGTFVWFLLLVLIPLRLSAFDVGYNSIESSTFTVILDDGKKIIFDGVQRTARLINTNGSVEVFTFEQIAPYVDPDLGKV